MSALMSACAGGHIETVKLLLERGATVDLTGKEVRNRIDTIKLNVTT